MSLKQDIFMGGKYFILIIRLKIYKQNIMLYKYIFNLRAY